MDASTNNNDCVFTFLDLSNLNVMVKLTKRRNGWKPSVKSCCLAGCVRRTGRGNATQRCGIADRLIDLLLFLLFHTFFFFSIFLFLFLLIIFFFLFFDSGKYLYTWLSFKLELTRRGLDSNYWIRVASNPLKFLPFNWFIWIRMHSLRKERKNTVLLC